MPRPIRRHTARPMRRILAVAACLHTASCWAPRDTGPRSMVGIVLDADGTPLEGVSVETVEARSVTDAQGRFGVNYKEPAQHVFFEHDGVRYQRDYLSGDDGTVVTIRTIETTPRALSCDTPAPCQAALDWDLGDGLHARIVSDCDPAYPEAVPMPQGMPDEATCRPDTTAPAVPHGIRAYQALDARGGFVEGLQIHPPPVRLTLRLTSPDRPMPDRCEVLVDGAPARPVGNGVYEAQVWGRVSAWAVCDGILGRPDALLVYKPVEWPLTWHRDHPVLDLREHWPDTRKVSLAQRSGRGHGWVVDLPRRKDGTWQLPPLVAGRYNLGLDAPHREVRYKQFRPEMPPGLVFVEGADIAAMRDDGSTYGVLDLTETVTSGTLPVHWATEEYDFRPDVDPSDRPD